MKNLHKFLVLIIGLSAFTTLAQKADSVIVIYDNQKIIVPLPAFGSQTSVSYADSNKVVEIGVWLRKPGETSPFSQLYSNDVNSGKSKSKSKWFSNLEAGYILGFTQSEGTYSYTYFNGEAPITYTANFSINNSSGYQFRLSLQESTFQINQKFSFTSGFKFGLAQSILKANSFAIESDSLGNQINSYNEKDEFKINCFQFLYQLGFSYHFLSGKLPARLNFGNSLGFLRANVKTDTRLTTGGFLYSSVLQPYLGLEIGKIGVLLSVDFALPGSHYYILPYLPLGESIGMAVTYRIF